MIKMDYSKEAYNIYKNRRGVDMNKVQQKKWISVLGMGVFILTMLYICTCTLMKIKETLQRMQR